MDEKNDVRAPENNPVPDNAPPQGGVTPEVQETPSQAAGAPDSLSQVAVAEEALPGDNASPEPAPGPPDISEGVDPVVEQPAKEQILTSEEMASMTEEERAMLMSIDDAPKSSSTGEGLLSQEDLDKAMQDAMAQSSGGGSGGFLDGADIPQAHEGKSFSRNSSIAEAVAVKNAEFQQLSAGQAGEKPRNIELLMDVELPISIELGRTRMNISDILALGPGSVVELDKLVGEPVDLLVNQKCVARGEVVVVEENFGLRITELVSTEERIKNL